MNFVYKYYATEKRQGLSPLHIVVSFNMSNILGGVEPFVLVTKMLVITTFIFCQASIFSAS